MSVQSSANLHFQRNIAQFFFALAVLLGLAGVFFFTPSLTTPTLLSYLFTLLLSPLINALERRGYPRAASIAVAYAVILTIGFFAAYWATNSLAQELASFKLNLPKYYDSAIHKLNALEARLGERIPLMQDFSLSERLATLVSDTSAWFIKNSAAVAGNLLSWSLIVPIFTFFFLKDGRAIKMWFFQLVPNRFFESTFMVANKIAQAISDYLRAKILEGSLVGLMTWLGLEIVGAPYAAVFGIIAGVTNIVPYVGPILGSAPSLLVVATGDQSHLLLAVAIVNLIANLIDNLVIFPVIVASLVNLSPLVLLAAVIAGQNYYGFVGMLISIPIASAFKVIIDEVRYWLYDNPSARKGT